MKDPDEDTGRSANDGGQCTGGWRMEVRPGGPRREDVFLHVLYASAAGGSDIPQARRMAGGTRKGVSLIYDGKEATVTSGTAADPAGHVVIRKDDRIPVDSDLTRKVASQCDPPEEQAPQYFYQPGRRVVT